jgi:repressor LexA
MDSNHLNSKEMEALRVIRNSLMRTERFPTNREIMYALGYKSTRSAFLLLEQLEKKKILRRKGDRTFQLLKPTGEDDRKRAETIDIPLIGNIACGIPIFAEENIDALIPVSIKLVPAHHRYFLLKAHGDSMNQRGINGGDMVLVRQQSNATNGDIVVALIDDSATVKEFRRDDNTILLLPRSTNPIHKPIVLTNDFLVQGVVVTSIPQIY